MTTVDFIIDLFCRVDTEMHDVPNHVQATLYPSELVCHGSFKAPRLDVSLT